jgi:hypothetical protein
MMNILTRDERRAMQRAKEKHVSKLMRGGYSQWRDVTEDPHTKSILRGLLIVPKKVYMNGMFTVQIYDTPNAWNAERVMIRWHDARSDHDWALFQRIKNDLFGTDRVALEVYPSEENKQDVANMYWLWVLPKDFNCPIEIKRREK